MSQYVLRHDSKKCIGCYSCEVHCKTNKNLSVGPRLCRIIEVGPHVVNGIPVFDFVFMPCFHCEKPWCVAACPTGAMQKRPNDGIVFVDGDRCVGCKLCMYACPWGAPQWNAETGKVVKCDFCKDRVDNGFKPACVSKCITKCLEFGTFDELEDIKRERFAQSVIYKTSNPNQ